MTWARAELVLAVLVLLGPAWYLQRLRKDAVGVTWSGLLVSCAFIGAGVLIFLSGLHDMRLYL